MYQVTCPKCGEIPNSRKHLFPNITTTDVRITFKTFINASQFRNKRQQLLRLYQYLALIIYDRRHVACIYELGYHDKKREIGRLLLSRHQFVELSPMTARAVDESLDLKHSTNTTRDNSFSSSMPSIPTKRDLAKCATDQDIVHISELSKTIWI